MKKLMGDQDHIKENLFSYIQGFSEAVRDIFERFEFYAQIDKLAKSGLLYQVTEKFVNVDLHPDKVSNSQMGLVFEELIRKFSEIPNETAGEHFTPREVIRLMVNLLFIVLAKADIDRTICDPTAGTGGMLSVAGEYPKLTPMKGAGTGQVQEKETAYLAVIIAKVNDLFEGELSDDDQLIYVNNVIKGKLLESKTLVQQAANNTKQQFANSPDLSNELMNAIMDALAAHSTMSKQALESEKVRSGLRDILLGPAQLYEALRERSEGHP